MRKAPRLRWISTWTGAGSVHGCDGIRHGRAPFPVRATAVTLCRLPAEAARHLACAGAFVAPIVIHHAEGSTVAMDLDLDGRRIRPRVRWNPPWTRAVSG